VVERLLEELLPLGFRSTLRSNESFGLPAHRFSMAGGNGDSVCRQSVGSSAVNACGGFKFTHAVCITGEDDPSAEKLRSCELW